MTLAELMVSTALFGIISLAVATLYAQNATLQARAQNEIRMESGAQEFINALEVSLGAATRVIACGCGAPGATPACAFTNDPAITPDCLQGPCAAGAPDPTVGVPLLIFEAEDSNEPSLLTTPGSGCFGSALLAGFPARGCKRIFEIRAIQPTISAAPGGGGPLGGLPGAIQVNKCRTDYSLSSPTDCRGNGFQTLGNLPGAYSVWCGHPVAIDAGGAIRGRDTAAFRIDIRAKAKFDNFNESWSPDLVNDPINAANPGSFMNGVHRTFSANTVLKNIAIRGAQFGKVSSDRCARDGADPTNFAGTCCSGYRSFSTGNCLSTSQCVRSGGAPSVQDQNSFIECCSHQLTQITAGGDFICL